MNLDVWGIIVGFIGSALLGALLTYLILRWQRQRKELVYQVEIVPFVEDVFKKEFKEKFLIKGVEVSGVHAVLVRIKNEGNVTLEQLDIWLQPSRSVQFIYGRLGAYGSVNSDIGLDRMMGEIKGMNVGFLNAGDGAELRVLYLADSCPDCELQIAQPGLICKKAKRLWKKQEILDAALSVTMEAHLAG